MAHREFDFLVVGGGVIGLALARELKSRWPAKTVGVLEKEARVAQHSSGRNSGVLHAGFYYTADSLKAKFTAEGNRLMQAYCVEKGLSLRKTTKLVLANEETEIAGIDELHRRGVRNGVNVRVVDEKEAREIEPNCVTMEKALFSPDTATVDPVEVCLSLQRDLEAQGVEFFFGHQFERRVSGNTVQAGGALFSAHRVINAAGLYGDSVAKAFGFGSKYCIIPFKGLYLKYTGAELPCRVHLYPVPNLNNPFLGVHFTITVSGAAKIGPTAVPAFWRENYGGLDGFRAGEFFEILSNEAKLFLTNSFGFRGLAREEMKKYNRDYFVGLAAKMVRKLDRGGFTEWSKPGIRAQLLDKSSLKLVQDFVVEGDTNSIHVLNAVSPGFTGSFPFARWVVDNYLK